MPLPSHNDLSKYYAPVWSLIPTQVCIGAASSESRTELLKNTLKQDGLNHVLNYLQQKPIHVVIGPERRLYALDRHHLCASLLDCAIDPAFQSVFSAVQEQLVSINELHLNVNLASSVTPPIDDLLKAVCCVIVVDDFSDISLSSFPTVLRQRDLIAYTDVGRWIADETTPPPSSHIPTSPLPSSWSTLLTVTPTRVTVSNSADEPFKSLSWCVRHRSQHHGGPGYNTPRGAYYHASSDWAWYLKRNWSATGTIIGGGESYSGIHHVDMNDNDPQQQQQQVNGITPVPTDLFSPSSSSTVVDGQSRDIYQILKENPIDIKGVVMHKDTIELACILCSLSPAQHMPGYYKLTQTHTEGLPTTGNKKAKKHTKNQPSGSFGALSLDIPTTTTNTTTMNRAVQNDARNKDDNISLKVDMGNISDKVIIASRRIDIALLKPTQAVAGMGAVAKKTHKLRKVLAHEGERALLQYFYDNPVPVIRSAFGLYLVDHHHLLLSIASLIGWTIGEPLPIHPQQQQQQEQLFSPTAGPISFDHFVVTDRKSDNKTIIDNNINHTNNNTNGSEHSQTKGEFNLSLDAFDNDVIEFGSERADQPVQEPKTPQQQQQQQQRQSANKHSALSPALVTLLRSIRVVEIADFSDLSWSDFWDIMKKKNKCYLKCLGADITANDLPTDVSGLRDDPFRTLSWLVRREEPAHITSTSAVLTRSLSFAPGYLKVATEFVEFIWGDYLRSHTLLHSISHLISQCQGDDKLLTLIACGICRLPDAWALQGHIKPPALSCDDFTHQWSCIEHDAEGDVCEYVFKLHEFIHSNIVAFSAKYNKQKL